MSDMVGLSSSRLSVLYKKRFNLSPNEDLIQMRIDKSKLLLLSTNLKLQHISQLCGLKRILFFPYFQGTGERHPRRLPQMGMTFRWNPPSFSFLFAAFRQAVRRLATPLFQ